MTRNMKSESMAYGGAKIDSLMAMLGTKRPHESKAEIAFIECWLMSLPGATQDAFGNVILRIAGNGDNILWSSHTDTVHNSPGRQAIKLAQDVVTLSPKAKANCLGADDTAGIWLMREMILAGRPGLYIFHRGEEIGGLGSNYIATRTPEVLDGIDAAIALDRKGYTSVITYQGSRCCSDTFAYSLSAALDRPDRAMGFKPDDSGLFTDTANYTDLIGECTNLSVGYFAQHSAKESLDIAFLTDLRLSLLAFDWNDLEFERKAGDSEYESTWYEDPNEPYFRSSLDRVRGEADSHVDRLSTQGDFDLDSYGEQEAGEIARVLRNRPDACAMALQDLGITLDELLQAIDYDNVIPF